MLLVFMGASCTGKSSAADRISRDRNLRIFTGKDYLRLDKNENEARKKFKEMLYGASCSKDWTEESLIYIMTDKDDSESLKLSEHAVFVLFKADPSLVKERFSERMKGSLPKPLEMMLEKQIKNWENVSCDLSFDTTDLKPDEITKRIIRFCEKDTEMI